MIDREAIQSWADAHHQNSLCGKPIVLKTTQTFLKPSSKLYRASWNLCERVKILLLENFSSPPAPATTQYVAPMLLTGSL